MNEFLFHLIYKQMKDLINQNVQQEH